MVSITAQTQKIVERLVGRSFDKYEWVLLRQALRALVQGKRMYPVPKRQIKRFVGINVERYSLEQAILMVSETVIQSGDKWKDALKSMLIGK